MNTRSRGCAHLASPDRVRARRICRRRRSRRREAQFTPRSAYDAVVLDLMVPKRSGWALLQDLRQSGYRTPVLILPARDAVDARVKALDLGADDYLPKPFAIAELVARLRALVRRSGGDPSPLLVVGDITIDRAARLVYRESVPVELTAREYSILELMVRNRGTLVTRSAMASTCTASRANVFSNVGRRAHRTALRRKLGPTVIHTRRVRATSSMRDSLRLRLVLWYRACAHPGGRPLRRRRGCTSPERPWPGRLRAGVFTRAR